MSCTSSSRTSSAICCLTFYLDCLSLTYFHHYSIATMLISFSTYYARRRQYFSASRISCLLLASFVSDKSYIEIILSAGFLSFPPGKAGEAFIRHECHTKDEQRYISSST